MFALVLNCAVLICTINNIPKNPNFEEMPGPMYQINLKF